MPELNSVALLAEGVDRNFKIFFVHTKIKSVALLAEGVDRNDSAAGNDFPLCGRPPRGGRG